MRILAFAILFSFLAPSLSAQSKAENDTYLKWFLRYRIQKTDLDNDGKISYKEVTADKTNLWFYYQLNNNFEIADKDKSKTLDFNELKAMRYREEGTMLQAQANQYDDWTDQFGREKLSDVNWIKNNTGFAAELLANYEWHQNNPALFSELSKSSWLGQNGDILKSINNNYFLLLKKPAMAGMLYNRYPKASTDFQKALKNYHKSQVSIKNASSNAGKKLTPKEIEKAKKAKKRTLN